MARIDDLLEQARKLDPEFGRELADELSDRPTFGLVFEDHLPEAVETPNVTPTVESRVRILPPRGSTTQPEPDVYEVVSIDGDEVLLTPDHPEGRAPAAGADEEIIETVTAHIDDIVTVARNKDNIFPGLRFDGTVASPGVHDDGPIHTMINAENSHALRLLQFTHTESIDTVYIDPPYNTLNDSWIYNDRYVSPDDAYRHSKWLSFMERRLKIAYELLKETGVIVVAIGDDEQHRLRMLMDKIFGERNFISNVVWQGGRKNNARFVSNAADYMLIYAKDIRTWSAAGVKATESPDVSTLFADQISEQGAKWRTPKPGVENVLAQGRKAWTEAGGDEDLATAAMRKWFRGLPSDAPEKAMARNVYFLPDGTLCRDDNISPPGGNGPRYEVLHPRTGQAVPVPSRGWLYSNPEAMSKKIDEGYVIFREDHTKPVSLKRPLDTVTGQVALSVFDRQRTHGSRHLYYPQTDGGVFPDARFPYPKDHTVLMRWLDTMTPRDGVILDFFGGSGTTLEAVLRLNEENETSERTCILVTNNEVSQKDSRHLRKDGYRPGDEEWERHGVYRHVTRPRIETILTGTRVDGSPYENTTTGCVNTFTLTYESPSEITYHRAFERVAGALWLRAGSRGDIISRLPESGWEITDHYGILRRPDSKAEFLGSVREHPGLRHVFVIARNDDEYRGVISHLPEGLDTTRLYESYLDNVKLRND